MPASRRSHPELELLLGGDDRDPDWIPIPQGVTTVSVREYGLDWVAEEPAVFTIESLGDAPDPDRLAPAEVAAQLEHALTQIERSLVHWND